MISLAGCPMHEIAQDLRPAVAHANSGTLAQRGAPYLLQWLASICFVSVIAGGAFPQIQILLLGGHVPITPAIFKALLIVGLGVAFFARGARCVISLQVALAIVLLLVLGVSTVHILLSSPLPLSDLLLSDFLMYFLLFLGCIVAAVPMEVPPRLLTKWLLFVFVVSMAIGLAQHFFNAKIISTDSQDGNFSVQAWNFYGQVRAFALFPSPMDFGFFCALIGNFGVVLAVRRHRRLAGWSIAMLAGLGCYTSLTRAAQICYIVGLPIAFILGTGRPKILVRLLPVCALATAIIVFSYGLTRMSQSNKGEITSSETFSIRISEWNHYLAQYREMSFANQVIGSGMVEQGGAGRVKHLANEGSMIMDNTYLALLINTGVIGLAVVLALYAAAWSVVAAKTAGEGSTLMVATAATFATLPFMASYGIVLNEMGMMLLLANLLAF
jgi:O-antigen ligase